MASSICGDNIVRNARQELTSEDKKYVEEHLNETNEIRENVIVKIRCWIEDELRIRIDNFLILRFLRVGKFNLEKTKARIRNYYKQQSDFPEWYMNKDPFRPELKELLDMGLFLPLRKLDNQGRLIIIVRSTRHDPRIHKVPDLVKISIMLIELAMKNNVTASVYGCAMFYDVINPTLRHIFQFRPYILMNMIHTWQSCYPIRIRSMNMINAPAFVDVTVKIIKSFMTEKMKSRFHIYSHMSLSCFKDIPANILPIEYGGTDGTIQELTDYWKKVSEENRDWLMNDENDKIE